MSNSASAHQTMLTQGRTPSAHASIPHPPAPRLPAATDIGLAGPSLTPNLNPGQPRRRDGASDSSNSTVQTSVSGPALTNGDGILPALQSGRAPAATSSTEPEHPVPATTNHNHEESTVILPPLPTWGSSVPLASPATSRPPAPAQNGGGSTGRENTGYQPATAKDIPSRAPTENGITHETQEGGAASSSSSIGKSKAATVEDFIEDVD
jgi:hypothetical protein